MARRVHHGDVVRVMSRGRFSVYVYAEVGQPHHLPHCHVMWPEGSAQVALPTLALLAGPRLPGAARVLLLDNLERLCDTWDTLNPEMPLS